MRTNPRGTTSERTAPASTPAPQSTRCRCGRCGAAYEAPAFEDLAPVHTYLDEELSAQFVRWPEGTVVDVRACARCQTPIARLTRKAS